MAEAGGFFGREDYISRSALCVALSIGHNLISLCLLKWLSRDQFSNSFRQSQRSSSGSSSTSTCVWSKIWEFLHFLASGCESSPSPTHSDVNLNAVLLPPPSSLHPSLTSIPPTLILYTFTHLHLPLTCRRDDIKVFTACLPAYLRAVSPRKSKATHHQMFLETFGKNKYKNSTRRFCNVSPYRMLVRHVTVGLNTLAYWRWRH